MVNDLVSKLEKRIGLFVVRIPDNLFSSLPQRGTNDTIDLIRCVQKYNLHSTAGVHIVTKFTTFPTVHCMCIVRQRNSVGIIVKIAPLFINEE